MPRIGVLGIGNVLMGDGAIGPHVVKTLEASYAFPEDVVLVDAGTPGLDLTAYVAGLETVLAVHSIPVSGRPGEVRRFEKDEVLRPPSRPSGSPHLPALRDALLCAGMQGGAPAAVRVLGVVPGRIGPVAGLSAEVRAAVPTIVAEVIAELRRLGVAVKDREPRGVADTWWEPRADGCSPEE